VRALRAKGAKMSTRYVVDRRVGVVCVRDTQAQNYEDGGYLSDSSAVVKKWYGKRYKKPKPPNYAIHYVPHLCLKAAERLCDKLNAEDADRLLNLEEANECGDLEDRLEMALG
jgi:phage gp36-like protein